MQTITKSHLSIGKLNKTTLQPRFNAHVGAKRKSVIMKWALSRNTRLVYRSSCLTWTSRSQWVSWDDFDTSKVDMCTLQSNHCHGWWEHVQSCAT